MKAHLLLDGRGLCWNAFQNVRVADVDASVDFVPYEVLGLLHKPLYEAITVVYHYTILAGVLYL